MIQSIRNVQLIFDTEESSIYRFFFFFFFAGYENQFSPLPHSFSSDIQLDRSNIGNFAVFRWKENIQQRTKRLKKTKQLGVSNSSVICCRASLTLQQLSVSKKMGAVTPNTAHILSLIFFLRAGDDWIDVTPQGCNQQKKFAYSTWLEPEQSWGSELLQHKTAWNLCLFMA